MRFFPVKAELDAGIEAIDDGCYEHAHAILLALYLSPEIPRWFRMMFCMPPLRALASTYLPTRAALCRMRHRASTRLEDGEHGAALLHRALMLDDALDDSNQAYGLLRRLDVLDSPLLVHCRDTVIPIFATYGDMQRARKYLGNYHDAMAALAAEASTPLFNDPWPEATLLARAVQYARRLQVIQDILRASGELQEADRVQDKGRLMLTDPACRDQVAREQREPGVCAGELRRWYERCGTHWDGQRVLDATHSHVISRHPASITPGPAR